MQGSKKNSNYYFGVCATLLLSGCARCCISMLCSWLADKTLLCLTSGLIVFTLRSIGCQPKLFFGFKFEFLFSESSLVFPVLFSSKVWLSSAYEKSGQLALAVN